MTGSRADYSRVKSVMKAIQEREGLELQVVATGQHLLDRYGESVNEIEGDGFPVHERIYLNIEGGNPVTMAQSTGLGIIQLATVLNQLKPDFVIAPTDRFETLSVAIAASFMNIFLAHIQGGEVTGTIDESIRHAITRLAHLHFPATERSRQRIIRMGERPETVFNVGCPGVDLLVSTPIGTKEELFNNPAVRSKSQLQPSPDLTKPFLLAVCHPVTTEYGHGYQQVQEVVHAIKRLNIQTIMLWPNSDAGSEDFVRGVRHFLMVNNMNDLVYLYKNFSNETFVQLMYHCVCMIGNSSAGIRETCYFGIPTVNIGTRQNGRERGSNVVDVSYDRGEIEDAVRSQMQCKTSAKVGHI